MSDENANVGTDDGESGDCPSAEVLVEFARGGGGLPTATRDAVSTHARGCEECGRVLAAFTRGSTPGTKSVGSEVNPGATLKLALDDPRLAPSRLPAAAPGVKPGDVLASKYRVERVIGLGGMGVVVAATHLQLGQEVALKLMLPHAFQSPEATARFLREARAAAQIQGEHVASVRDVGTLENGAPFIVMELLRGTDLAELLKARGGLTPDEAIEYVLQACEALAEAHGAGIIHRDLKPANLFLAERPDGSSTIKVLDFGISKSRDATDDPNLTHSKSVMGTPRYMSPEQMRSTKSAGPATDVWALGCILYELLSARPAFDADTTQGLALAIAQDPTPSVRVSRPEVPLELEQVLYRCLEKDPACRIASIAELAKQLTPFAPKAAEVSIERILRFAKRSARPPGRSFASAATIASAHPPVAMTDPGFARSNHETSPPKSRVPLAVLLGGAVAIGIAVTALLMPVLQTRGQLPVDGSRASSRPESTALATNVGSATGVATAVATAEAPPASSSSSATLAPTTTARATPTANLADMSIRTPTLRPTPNPVRPIAPVAPPAAPVTDTRANELLDRK